MKKRRKIYKKALIIYIVILLIISLLFLGYVANTMIKYENSLVENYIKYLAKSGEIEKHIGVDKFEKSKYENNNNSFNDSLSSLLQSDNIKLKKVSDKKNTYNILSNDTLLATVKLKNQGSKTRLMILKIDEWAVDHISADFDRGIYYYDIYIPQDYKLYINDMEVLEKGINNTSETSEIGKLGEYIDIFKTRHYIMNNFIKEPDIKIIDENAKIVKYKIKNNKIEIEKDFKKYDTFEETKKHISKSVDALGIIKKWSLFLTDDLPGTRHGFDDFSNYLIKDSYMYKMAYQWAHNVDISLVSSHVLKNPVFTNDYIKNCTVYNENAFKCEVYLEKNMVVSGRTKVDKLHDYVYFVNYNGSFKLVDMLSIAE